MVVLYINTHTANQAETVKQAFPDCQTLDDINALLAFKADKDITVILPHTTSETLYAQITQIRQSDQLFITPVFTDSLTEINEYSDGNIQQADSVQQKAKQIASLAAQLKVDAKDWRSKLLQYLYTRPDAALSAYRSWDNENYYYYPLINVFSGADEDNSLWLDDLVMQNTLERKQLKDKLFTCPYCSSAHLKFTDRCPNCQSINIQMESFLHCFSCGEMGPQQEFVKKNRLVCPNCSTQLKHIGDEYDRPLESGTCLDCHNNHIDSILDVSCMLCNKEYPTDKLHKRSIYDLSLTTEARQQIPSGTTAKTLQVFDQINYVIPEFFYATLDWLIAMQRRYEDQTFSIIGIKISKDNANLSTMVQRLAQQVRKTLRLTDLLTRVHETTLWIILPKTDKQGLDIVNSRILPEDLDQNEVELNLMSFTSSKDMTSDTASVLIAKLATDL